MKGKTVVITGGTSGIGNERTPRNEQGPARFACSVVLSRP